MTNKLSLIILLIICIQLGCNSDPNKRLKEGQIIDNKYSNERFGIELVIPEDWRVITKLEANYYKNKGGDLAEKEFGDNRSDSWTELLQLQKGISLNQMMITYSIYKPELHGNCYVRSKETRFEGMKKILENNPGIEVETVRTETELDGIQFDTYNMLIRKEGEIKGYQILLEKKYANNEVLLMTIVTKEREILEELRTLIESMKIKRKS